jgi:hypothetical protein
MKKKKKLKLCYIATFSCLALYYFLSMDNQIQTLLNFGLHLATWGSSLLNNQSFLSVQIHQHIIMIISIANDTLSNRLMCLVALASLSHIGALIPIWDQRLFAKEHLSIGSYLGTLVKENWCSIKSCSFKLIDSSLKAPEFGQKSNLGTHHCKGFKVGVHAYLMQFKILYSLLTRKISSIQIVSHTWTILL